MFLYTKRCKDEKLQRGRPQLRAECQVTMVDIAKRSELQRGRPQLRAECRPFGCGARGQIQASTGPPSIEGGMELVAQSIQILSPRFNGAALN